MDYYMGYKGDTRSSDYRSYNLVSISFSMVLSISFSIVGIKL